MIKKLIETLKGEKNILASMPSAPPTFLIDPIIALNRLTDASPAEKLLYSGHNTGNMLFVNAMKEQLNYEKIEWFVASRYEEKENASAVMPASNFISLGKDTSMEERLLDFLKETSFPFTLAGLGAQASDKIKTPKELMKVQPAKRVEFLKALSERAVSIGVRGEFTAQCLEEIGIHNYRIIGCPSVYFSLGAKIKKVGLPSSKKIVVNVTTGNVFETKIMEIAAENSAHWIMQMETELPEKLLAGEVPLHTSLQKAFPGLKMSPEETREYSMKYAHMFFSMEQWTDFLKKEKFSFSFGSRFHGNMAAFRAGIPALWVVHDSRTKELVKSLHLPHIDYNQLNESKNVQKLMEYCDYSEFYKEYPHLRQNYIHFLNENKLNHNFSM